MRKPRTPTAQAVAPGVVVGDDERAFLSRTASASSMAARSMQQPGGRQQLRQAVRHLLGWATPRAAYSLQGGAGRPVRGGAGVGRAERVVMVGMARL
jgi:hypothetical protein